MFCPRCSTQNELNQGYCRQCGQSLAGVRLALEGNIEPSLEKLKDGNKLLRGGSNTLAAFTLIGMALTSLGIIIIHEPAIIIIGMINLLLGLMFGLPLVFIGRLKLKRGTRQLSNSLSDSNPSLIEQYRQPDNLVTAGASLDLNKTPVLSSVTENTTLHLQKRTVSGNLS